MKGRNVSRRKGISIGSDGKLDVSEKSVEATIEAFLVAEGWQYIHTKAENLTRSGAPAHAKDTLDALAVRPIRGDLGPVQCFYMELKRRRAHTNRKHLLGQSDTASYLRSQGFLVYQAPENFAGDMFANFKDFYQYWRHKL